MNSLMSKKFSELLPTDNGKIYISFSKDTRHPNAVNKALVKFNGGNNFELITINPNDTNADLPIIFPDDFTNVPDETEFLELNTDKFTAINIFGYVPRGGKRKRRRITRKFSRKFHKKTNKL